MICILKSFKFLIIIGLSISARAELVVSDWQIDRRDVVDVPRPTDIWSLTEEEHLQELTSDGEIQTIAEHHRTSIFYLGANATLTNDFAITWLKTPYEYFIETSIYTTAFWNGTAHLGGVNLTPTSVSSLVMSLEFQSDQLIELYLFRYFYKKRPDIILWDLTTGVNNAEFGTHSPDFVSILLPAGTYRLEMNSVFAGNPTGMTSGYSANNSITTIAFATIPEPSKIPLWAGVVSLCWALTKRRPKTPAFQCADESVPMKA